LIFNILRAGGKAMNQHSVIVAKAFSCLLCNIAELLGEAVTLAYISYCGIMLINNNQIWKFHRIKL